MRARFGTVLEFLCRREFCLGLALERRSAGDFRARLRGRSVRRMRQFHSRPQRHVFEVRHVRQHDGVFVIF